VTRSDDDTRKARRSSAEPNPLRMVPVVLVSSPTQLAPVRAGIARAGKWPAVVVATIQGWGSDDENDPGPPVGSANDALRTIPADGAEVVVICHGPAPADAIEPCRAALGRDARPMPVLKLALDRGVDDECLQALSLLPGGVNVPVPSIADDVQRRLVWDTLVTSGIEQRHHLVEVDGQPALDELSEQGVTVEGDLMALLAAGAGGVLAGRMAIGNRRWRDQLP
jgi:hypothetical protein